MMTTSDGHNEAEEANKPQGLFEPRTPSASPISTGGRWKPMLESDCTFQEDAFLRVMHNLIKNPNIMSTHLFRADIFYDSEKDNTIIEAPGTDEFSGFTRHLKQEYRPKYLDVPGYKWQKTYVRQLIPRNRQLDKDLVQTCHFYAQQQGPITKNLILYIPHVDSPGTMPWYHPKVEMVAFLHEWTADSGLHQDKAPGTVSVHYFVYPDSPIDQRLERTALQLLTKIHKHGRGQQAGYQKRVHHDQVVSQQRFQETYARLKTKYAKTLIDNWVEDTDPGKHVFEDLGIAAFLIELWADMYDCSTESQSRDTAEKAGDQQKPPFPGFVDIGCGNGLLVNLLIMEGYQGWGFDARKRKTWKTFSPTIQQQVSEHVLVPEVLDPQDSVPDNATRLDPDDLLQARQFHNGLFKPGTFIVSNHADELTPWTPLLAYLNDSPFIAIPCCSHNLAGAKWRAPPSKKAKQKAAAQKPQDTPTENDAVRKGQAAETGSLKKPDASKRGPSAYASLCDYVSDLAEEVGIVAEKEVLRIPSTRNVCILGRKRIAKEREQEQLSEALDNPGLEEKQEQVRAIVARELNAPIDDVCKDWTARARQIAGKKGDGH